MDSIVFVSLVNPAISLVLATAFTLLWRNQRQHMYLAVLAFSYVASATGFIIALFTLPLDDSLSKLISNICFTAAVLGASGAVTWRYCRTVPYIGMGTMAVGGLSVFCWFLFVDPDLTWRIYAVNFAFGGITLVVFAQLRRIPVKEPVEWALLALSLLSGLNFLVRPLLSVAAHGQVEGQQDLFESLYWTTAVLAHAVMSLMIALTLITSAALDILKALKAESQTDALSGLLNRRGFEEAAAQALRKAARLGQPTALVIADLDHFKSVNDTFGHSAGDRVIFAFAEQLRAASGQNGIAGRIGGEEFAVLLTSADLNSARLFAEGVRVAIALARIDAVPSEARITASFGVAASGTYQPLQAMLRRADEALYRAKKNGRDTVRLASHDRRADSLRALAAPAEASGDSEAGSRPKTAT